MTVEFKVVELALWDAIEAEYAVVCEVSRLVVGLRNHLVV